MKMRAARMYGYQKPLRIDEVPVPEPGPDEILLKVAACGMCRSDYQLVDGYFKGPFPVEFPYILGQSLARHYMVGKELSYLGSIWANHLDLVELLSLAEAGRIKHNVTKVKLDDINGNLEALARGDVVGRQVIVFD